MGKLIEREKENWGNGGMECWGDGPP